jgi:uncharacterized damage-inducible protein DinB
MTKSQAAAVTILEATPGRIATATQGRTDRQLTKEPAPDAWSVNQVLAHLRACADVWGASIERILKEDTPSFRYVSPRAWIRTTNYLNLEFQPSFLAFQQQRAALLLTLKQLSEADWRRRAVVKASKLREETVESYVCRLAEHEAGHCAQIERIVRIRPSAEEGVTDRGIQFPQGCFQKL